MRRRRSSSFLFRRPGYPCARDSLPMTSVFRNRHNLSSETVFASSNALISHQPWQSSQLLEGLLRGKGAGTYSPFFLYGSVLPLRVFGLDGFGLYRDIACVLAHFFLQ